MRARLEEHPGQILRRVLNETGLSVIDAAERLRVSRSQLQRLLGEQSGISPEMALRLEAVFGVDASESISRQTAYDLARARREAGPELSRLSRHSGRLTRRSRERVVETLRRREARLRKSGIDELYLFGSVARDSATPASDVDLFYREAPGCPLGLIEIGSLEDELSELLHAEVDLAPVVALRSDVRARALEDAIRVF